MLVFSQASHFHIELLNFILYVLVRYSVCSQTRQMFYRECCFVFDKLLVLYLRPIAYLVACLFYLP